MADLSPEQFSAAVLKGLGIRQTPGAMQAMVGWTRAEGGHYHNDAKYNPLNTTQNMPGAGNTGSQGNIKVYKSWQQGVDATVKTLRYGAYTGILSALKTGNAGKVANAIGQTPWGTSAGLVRSAIMGTKPSMAAAPDLGGSSAQPVARAAAAPDLINPAAPAVAGPDRAAVLQNYLQVRGRPGALLGLAGQLQAADTIPAASGVTPIARTAPNAVTPGTAADPSVKGTANFEGTKVAAWILPALQYGREHGWKGKVNSGYRSFADQTRIYNSGVRPAAKPGTSNHEGTDFPRGAVDVSDPQVLSNILLKSQFAKQLVFAGAKDPVHFSHPHGGSY